MPTTPKRSRALPDGACDLARPGMMLKPANAEPARVIKARRLSEAAGFEAGEDEDENEESVDIEEVVGH